MRVADSRRRPTSRTLEAHQEASDWIAHEKTVDDLGDTTFRSFVDQLPETVLHLDATGHILYANPAWLALRNLDLDDCVGRFHPDLVDPADRPMQIERLGCLQRLTPEDRELQALYEATGIGWRSVVYTAWFNDEGDLRLITAVGRDRTEGQQVKVAMEVANRRLADSNRELEDFAYVASHDLQEPLRKILAFSGRLATKLGDDLDEQGVDYLERVRTAGQRMQVLIEDLLRYSHVATREEAATDVDLNRVVAGVVSDLEFSIAEASATVSVGPLPILRADEFQMRQLFQSLITNAIKFRSSDRAPVVEVRAEREFRPGATQHPVMGWSLSVADNGIGFDEKYLDKIFTVFQRLHGPTEYDGSGVGLSMCRRIAERQNGELTAASVAGKGSTFTLWVG